MSYVQRTNPSITGMGCAHCGGEGDCWDSPAYGYTAAQSARDQAGVNYTGSGMLTSSQKLAVATNGAVQPLTPINSGGMSWMPFSWGRAVNTPGTAANNLANTTPDNNLNPTQQTVIQSFSNDTGGAQPGVLPLYPNATADGLSFVRKPPVSLQCQASSAISAHPLLLVGGAFALFYLLNQKKGRA